MEKTWRWFGYNDAITLDDIRAIGVEGIVTALHHLPNGVEWPVDEIEKVKSNIESHGMTWSVVESLPVHEEIKYAGSNRDLYISNYKKSLRNLGQCGVRTVCYNFMPVIDWIRTDLDYKLPEGGTSLYFDFIDFVVFDLFLLKRLADAVEYPNHIIEAAGERYKRMTLQQKMKLVDTIIIKTQGFIDGISADNYEDAITIFKERLSQYDGIGKDELRANLKYFLDEVTPVAEEMGIALCIHPDDPPMPVLGLPRIVSNSEDLKWILKANTSPANGITFCTGSLSANKNNDLLEMLDEVIERVKFVHLRSTQTKSNGDFYEAEHLKGSVPMPAIVKRLLEEIRRREKCDENALRVPMRVDHGHVLPGDSPEKHNPGYPFVGRLKGLAEIDGLQQGIITMLKE
ncbi:mannonate dehydratase [Puteibacter caeruleilacunae]|nr:mannonate dehydratase [Puteibacter caeruleilacunae]